MTFRRRFASKDLVDSSKGWTYYRDAIYQKTLKTPKVSEHKRNAVVMLKLKVPSAIDLETLDSRLQQWIRADKGTPGSLAEFLHESGIQFDSCEVFYGKDTQ